MKTFEFKAEQFLPVSIARAWDFFSSPTNLSVITPPSLDFVVLTDTGDKEIYSGMIINYTVRPLFGVPVKWRTEITNVDKPYSFTDRQVKGPYTLWEHKHYFVEKNNGVVVIDHVHYRLPFGVFGVITHSLLVKKKLNAIFDFRRKTLAELFAKQEA